MFLPSWLSERLSSRLSAQEDKDLSVDIVKGCADRLARLKTLLVTNESKQTWQMIDRCIFVITTKGAVSEEEAGAIISMSKYCLQMPGLEIYTDYNQVNLKSWNGPDWAKLMSDYTTMYSNGRY